MDALGTAASWTSFLELAGFLLYTARDNHSWSRLREPSSGLRDLCWPAEALSEHGNRNRGAAMKVLHSPPISDCDDVSRCVWPYAPTK